MKGQYILFMRLKQRKEMTIGKLGTYWFPKGRYAYVGSALRGIEARVGRHLREKKALHWHIDHFLRHAIVEEVEFFPTLEKAEECRLAEKIGNKGSVVVKGFGSSDCSCESHLFFLGQ